MKAIDILEKTKKQKNINEEEVKILFEQFMKPCEQRDEYMKKHHLIEDEMFDEFFKLFHQTKEYKYILLKINKGKKL
jgi:hypothetical protein